MTLHAYQQGDFLNAGERLHLLETIKAAYAAYAVAHAVHDAAYAAAIAASVKVAESGKPG